MKIVNSYRGPRHRFEELPNGTLFRECASLSGEIYLKIERAMPMPEDSQLEIEYDGNEVKHTFLQKRTDDETDLVMLPMNAIRLSEGICCYFKESTIVEPLHHAVLFEDEDDVPKKNNP